MSRIAGIILFLVSFFSPGNQSCAQIMGMRKYTQLDGYTATKGYEIEQDERGYIWFGTDNGGMSFDGKTFRVATDMRRSPDAEILFTRPIGNSHILLLPLNNDVSYLHKGRLYTSAEDKRLTGIKLAFNNCTSDQITGAWWLSDLVPTTLYRFHQKEIRKYEIKNNAGFSYVGVINDNLIGQENHPGNILKSVYYNSRLNTFRYLYDESGKMKVDPFEIMRGVSPDHIVYYHSREKKLKVYRYNLADSILRFVKSINIPTVKGLNPFLTIDRNHNLWLKLHGTEDGAIYYGNITGNDTAQISYQFTEPTVINSLFIDKNNNLWISTPNNALWFLSEKHFKNALLTAHIPNKKWIPQAISGDGKGTLCISYINHSEFIYIKGNHTRSIKLNKKFTQGSRHILPLDSNRFMLLDAGIALLDIQKNTVIYSAAKILCKDICRYGANGLIIAEIDGVYYISSISDMDRKRDQIFNKRTNTVEVLENKRILMGTPDGLYLKKDLTAPAVKISHPVLSKSNITDILSIRNGGAFIGTNAQGLFLISGDNRIERIKLSGNNASDHIRRLYKQNDSTYWMATDDGAYSVVFDKNWSVTGTKNYTFYDGLPSNNIVDLYVCSDTAYFATTQGLGIIPLNDSSRLWMAPPGVYINTIQSDDSIYYEPDSIVSLSYDQNNLLVSLSAISYESVGNVRYYYQLYPYQHNWIETTNPEIRFTELSPGEYKFRAYATNAKGIRSERTIEITIVIKPAFWQATYSRIILFLLAGTLLYIVMRWWIQGQEKKKYEKVQQKKRLAELELEAIKAQINPHFIYNCLNSVKYLNYKAEYQQAQEYLNIFARLIRMTMQYSRRAFITLDEETDYLSNYLKLEKLRFKDKLEYTIHEEEGIDRNILLPAMLLQPYVENALKHGIAGKKEGGKVWIGFRKENDMLRIVIEDNGPGFSGSGTHDSLGLYLTGTRAMSYNELFNLGIQVQYSNKQDRFPGETGAIVEIIINTTNYESPIHKSGYYRR